MSDKTGSVISGLVSELDAAVMRGDTEKADEIADILFCLQGGTPADTVMPASFPETVKTLGGDEPGNHQKSPKRVKRIIGIAAAAALVMALSMTALATNFFGLRDMVITPDRTDALAGPGSAVSEAAGATESPPIDGGQSVPELSYDLIPMQGYPDSSEYKASAEWELFRQSFDPDGSIAAQVGNEPNDYTVKYPLYNIYAKEMADKLEEIIAKYGLTLHTTITIAESPEELISLAGTGNFLDNKSGGGANRPYSGYVYDDGAFAFDGEAALQSGAFIQYQFGNYEKGVFSDVCLNIGDAGAYQEWQYVTKSGVTVSLALSETKALIIADRANSFVVVNVLAGTGDSGFGSDSITQDDLESFADMFDLTQIN